MTDHVQDPAAAHRISRRWPVISSGVAILAAVLLGLIALVRGNTPFEADAEWMEEILEHRNPIWDVPAFVMDFAGGGWFSFLVPIVFIGVLLFLRRFWAALYFGLAMGISPLLVQLLKGLFDRPRPE